MDGKEEEVVDEERTDNDVGCNGSGGCENEDNGSECGTGVDNGREVGCANCGAVVIIVVADGEGEEKEEEGGDTMVEEGKGNVEINASVIIDKVDKIKTKISITVNNSELKNDDNLLFEI